MTQGGRTDQARRPPGLKPGDRIAIVSPSAPVRAPRRLARGVATLTNLGFEVIVGPRARAGAAASERDARARADELNGFLADRTIRAVVAAIGGYTSNAVLPYVDYAALRRDPKIICGYSDITALLLACRSLAGIVTFHGPTLLPEIAEFPAAQPYTMDYLQRAVSRQEPVGQLTPADSWTDEFLLWDHDDNRPRTMRRARGWRWLTSGSGCGPLVGGNLETISALAGTRYLPDFGGAVVFLETVGLDIDLVERSMTHLDMLGVFGAAAAVLFGRPFRSGAEFGDQLADLLLRHLGDRSIPVITDVDLGHTDPMLTLPIGVQAHVDYATGSVEIVDAAVS
jgi:muramoyltetrapeptide carboxypeptidase